MCTSTYESFPLPEDGRVPSLNQYNSRINNRYRILKPLGKGGFGQTFLAVDEKHLQQTQEIPSLKHPLLGLCVIKQFFPERCTVYRHQKASQLFQQESWLLAELGKHPQIPQFLDSFEQDGQQYIVQEWVEGQTLEQELTEAGAFNEAQIRQLLGELLPVLQFVHDHQVIHRDIKPANIIRRRSNGQLVLVDFGISKYTNGCIQEKTGTLIGSAEYAAPEQIKGKAVFASDLYSLGVTCLHLLTQMSPFDLHDCSEDAWIWREYLTKPISRPLERILCKLVQRPTKRRYQSAQEVLKDLNALPKQVVVSSQPIASSSAEDDDFETPYFGFCGKENLQYASTISYTTKHDIYSNAAVIVSTPQTQAWYHLPPKTQSSDFARKVAAFLCLRLAAAATPPVQEQLSSVVSSQTKLIPKNVNQIILTAIAFTIACLIWVMETNSTFTTTKVEILKTFEGFFNQESK